MFTGHYSASFAGKALDRTIPLWVLFVAVQLLDFVWAILIRRSGVLLDLEASMDRGVDHRARRFLSLDSGFSGPRAGPVDLRLAQNGLRPVELLLARNNG